MERERLATEQMEKERLATEQMERERLAQMEKESAERIAQEIREKATAHQQLQEKIEKEIAETAEKVAALEKEASEQMERERLAEQTEKRKPEKVQKKKKKPTSVVNDRIGSVVESLPSAESVPTMVEPAESAPEIVVGASELDSDNSFFVPEPVKKSKTKKRSRRITDEEPEKGNENWRKTHEEAVPKRLKDTATRKEEKRRQEEKQSAQEEQEKKEQQRQEKKRADDLKAKQDRDRQTKEQNNVERKRQADQRTAERETQRENDEKETEIEDFWNQMTQELTISEIRGYSQDIRNLISKHTLSKMTFKIFTDHLREKYQTDTDKLYRSLHTLYRDNIEKINTLQFKNEPYRPRPLVPTRTPAEYHPTPIIPWRTLEPMDSTQTVSSASLLSNKGRTMEESLVDTRGKMTRAGAGTTERWIQSIDIPPSDPRLSSQKKTTCNGAGDSRRVILDSSINDSLASSSSESRKYSALREPVTAANQLFSVPSKFYYAKDDSNIVPKRRYVERFGEPLYPSDSYFERLAASPIKRVKKDDGLPLVDSPTVQEVMSLSNPEQSNKGNFHFWLECLKIAAASIIPKQPIKLVVDDMLKDPTLSQVTTVNIEILVAGTAVAWKQFGQLNENLKRHYQEREDGDGSLCPTYMRAMAGWKLTEQNATTKRQRNFVCMAIKLCAELIKHQVFERFELFQFVDHMYPHMLNVSKAETELLVVSLAHGLQSAPLKSNSMRIEGRENPRGQSREDVVITSRVAKTMTKWRMFKMPSPSSR